MIQGPPSVETPRLLLRAPRPEDVDPLFEIQGNALAMQFTYCAPDREATARYLDSYAARFAVDGFAPWTAVLADAGRVVGWGGLNRDAAAPHWGVEVSYFIHPACSGRGLATEIVSASLDLAFDLIGLPLVSAFTRPQNRASARVLEKAGFQRVDHVAELERDRYSITTDHWRASSTGTAAIG